MTVAPIAIVATLRETSVLFGAAIAVVVLKEPLRPVRIAAVPSGCIPGSRQRCCGRWPNTRPRSAEAFDE